MSRKIPDTITEEELIKIVKATKEDKYKLAFLLGFYQAMRVSEVVKLKPKNIKKKSHLIEIKQSKGAKDRNIPIIKPIQLNDKAMLRALNKLPVGVGKRSLQRKLKQKALEVIDKDIHFHTLRHSGATWLLNEKGWNVRQVQQFLGHAKLQTTQIYLHVNPQDLVNLEWDKE